jgi:hypothetical protein
MGESPIKPRNPGRGFGKKICEIYIKVFFGGGVGGEIG